MNEYSYYILMWILILGVLFILFKYLPVKIKHTEDPRTKNSLFVILMMLAVPLILAVIIGPILLLAGDENMPVRYKYGYGVISVVVIAYLVYLQTTKPKKNS